MLSTIHHIVPHHGLEDQILYLDIKAPEAGLGTTGQGGQGSQVGFPRWGSSFLQGIVLSRHPSRGCDPCANNAQR